MQGELPNNPLKLPLMVVAGVAASVAVVVGVLSSHWVPIAFGTIALIGSVWTTRAIRQGRNPRWMRSPLDRWWQRRFGS